MCIRDSVKRVWDKYVESGELEYRGAILWLKNHAKIHRGRSMGVGSVANKPFPRDSYEMIYIFRYGNERRIKHIPRLDRKFTLLMRQPWIIQPDNERTKRGGFHMATFPVELVTNMLYCFTVAGEVVLDPFMGSGTTLRGAMKMGRAGWGIELNPEFAEYAIKKAELNKYSLARYIP